MHTAGEVWCVALEAVRNERRALVRALHNMAKSAPEPERSAYYLAIKLIRARGGQAPW